MLLPTLLMGTLFPLAIKIMHFRMPTFGRLAGDVYAVNTMGAILGAFCGGFVLIPMFGIQGSALYMVYLNLILGLLVILIAPPTGQGSWLSKQGFLRGGLIGGILILTGSLVAVKPSWNAQIMSTGVFLHLPEHAAQLGQADRKKFYQELEKDRELLFYKEGITATITVERHQSLGLYMRVNGRKEAGERFMRTQALIAHIPMLMAQKPDDVLIIGFGSGATAGSAAKYPVKKVRVVELEPAVIEASRFFEPENQRPLDDPRVEVQINDGRNALLASSEAFDVIISQPSVPWITGASNLFTREFFDLGAMHLKEGGIFGQWISGDVISPENFRSLVKAFHEAFPITWLFETIPGDYLLVGSREQPDLSMDKLEGIFGQESIRQDLMRVGVKDPYD
ncbi:MAG: spermidine synthase, partial [Nitrospiria bacterium]